MRIAIAAAAAAATLLAAGCASPGTTTSSDCMSHYVHVADAPSRAALLQELREDVDPRVQDLRVIDDGPGYPPHLLNRIGEPYLRDRRSDKRPEDADTIDTVRALQARQAG